MLNFDKLVLNGCSYAEYYADGNGQVDLAERLGIPQSDTLALGGSCNSRIIRTTLKHSYQTDDKCLYLVGITFLSRSELSVLSPDPKRDFSFEGNWLSIQNHFGDSRTGSQGHMTKYDRFLSSKVCQADIQKYIDLRMKFDFESIADRLDDLQYRILSMIADLRSRGHDVIVFSQAADVYDSMLDHPSFDHLSTDRIIDQLRWKAIGWQHENGVPAVTGEEHIDPDLRHRAIGKHHDLNAFLAEYILKVINPA